MVFLSSFHFQVLWAIVELIWTYRRDIVFSLVGGLTNLPYFDPVSVNWQPLPGADGNPEDHIGMSIMNVDDEAKIVDVLFKFAASEKILLHRHTSHFNTFVVQGKHRIYEPDRTLKETRPEGTYKVGVPDA